MPHFCTSPTLCFNHAAIPKEIVPPSAVTVDGVATFYLTDDFTINGNATLTHFDGAWPVAQVDTDNPTECPKCSIKSISQDLKTLEINVTVGRTLLALGATEQKAPDGTVVYVRALGYYSV